MRKIYFGPDRNKQGVPFWQPWGCLGCLWRLIAFLILLFTLLFILSLFRECSHDSLESELVPESYEENGDPIIDTEGENPDADSDELEENSESEPLFNPRAENRAPNFRDVEPISDPEYPEYPELREVYPNFVYIILDTEEENAMQKFGEAFKKLYPDNGYKIESFFPEMNTLVLSVPQENLIDVKNNLPQQIKQETGIDCYPTLIQDHEFGAYTPNDPGMRDAEKSWYFDPIQIKEAWEITQGSSDVIVGVVDSYMDLTHPELPADRCVAPYSVMKSNSDVAPPATGDPGVNNHGTEVTSLIVGAINNNKGVAGIAPKCKYIPVSLGEQMNTFTIAQGILYCIYKGATVINVSLQILFPDYLTMQDQLDISKNLYKDEEKMWNFVFNLAEKRNATIVWAAGNTNTYIAMDAKKRNLNTIKVSALDQDLKRADFSNYGYYNRGTQVESTISAPGVHIYVAAPNNSYEYVDGTSFSAPIVAGVVALIKSRNKDLTTDQIIKILQSSGKPISGSTDIGKLIQAKDALIKAKELVGNK